VDKFELNVEIPANTTATIYLPACDLDNIRESGKTLAVAEGVKLLRYSEQIAVLAVGSGTYHFSTFVAKEKN
jgi:alpha-L-rhamnosidase